MLQRGGRSWKQLVLFLAICQIVCHSRVAAYTKFCKTLYIVNPTNLSKSITELQDDYAARVNGCEYIHGDLIFQQLGTNSQNGRPLNEVIRSLDTKFLDSIKEISGSLVLDQVGISRVHFKNLRIIRGYTNKESLQLNQCAFLDELAMPNLTVIGTGNVVLRSAISSKLYCRLKSTVNWKLLFQSDGQFVEDKLQSIIEADRLIPKSELTCPKLSCNSKCNRTCWTQRPNDCQTDSSCVSKFCASCYKEAGTGQEECCHENCLGGCTARGKSSCFACRDISKNNTCVDDCPDGLKYDPAKSEIVSIHPPWVRVGDVCLPSCPSPFVTDLRRRFCLAKCPPSQMVNEGKNCDKCAADGQSCVICSLKTRQLSPEWRNKNCTVLDMTRETFSIDGKILKSKDSLLGFQSVRVIQVDNFMVKRTESLTDNLEFLQKVRFVKGVFGIFELKAEYLGLAGLRKAGSLQLFKVSGLCKAWYPQKFLSSTDRFKFQSKEVALKTDGNCASAKCDFQCKSECWGPGPHLCVDCKNFRIEGTCYESCEAGGRYSLIVQDKSTGVDKIKCGQCHKECSVGCSGPEPSSCISCRHFQEDGVCVERCSKEYSVDSDGNCYSTSSRRIARVLLICGILIGLLLIGAIILLLYFRRRMQKYEVVELDEYLLDSKNPSDMVQLMVVNNDDLVKQKEIGSGAFGTVFKGLLMTKTAKGIKELPVAIKELRGKNPTLSQELLSEASVLARVRHPRCIRLVAVCMTENVQLITTLMPRGCLLDFLKSHRARISANRMLNWAGQVADGMNYLESMNIVHRDLAARNILLQTLDDVKITDFGLAKLLNVSDSEYLHTSGMLPVKWLGIECFESGVFSHKSDVWSFGVFLWEICTFGESPYKPYRISSVQDITDILRKGIRLSQPVNCGIDLYNVMLSCWLPSPDSRPTFKELSHLINEFMKTPHQYIAASTREGINSDDEDEDGTVTFSDGTVQLRHQQQQQGPSLGYAPMSQVEQDSKALLSGSTVKQNIYVPEPTSRVHPPAGMQNSPGQRQTGDGQSETDRLMEDRPDAVGGDDADYLTPISSQQPDPRESEYLQPRSLVTSDPVPIEDDYLAPTSNC